MHVAVHNLCRRAPLVASLMNCNVVGTHAHLTHRFVNVHAHGCRVAWAGSCTPDMIGNNRCDAECNRAVPVYSTTDGKNGKAIKHVVDPCQSYDVGDCSAAMGLLLLKGAKLVKARSNYTAEQAIVVLESVLRIFAQSDIGEASRGAGSSQCTSVQTVEQKRQAQLKDAAIKYLNFSVDTTPQPLQVVEGASGWEAWQDVFQ